MCQEGYSAFATMEEAYAEVLHVLDLYSQIYEDFLAIPVIKGQKRKLSTGHLSTTVQVFIPETGVGVEGAASEFLEQELTKDFRSSLETEVGLEKSIVWQNSWGFNTTIIGLIIMIHGDDNGLVLPPNVAPIQAVVIPVTSPKAVPKKLSEACDAVASALEATNIQSEGGIKRLSELADCLLRSSEAAGILSEVDLKTLSEASDAIAAGFEGRDVRSEADKRLSETCAATASALEAAGIRTEVDQLGDIALSHKGAHWMRKEFHS